MKILKIVCAIGFIMLFSFPVQGKSYTDPDSGVTFEYFIRNESVFITGCNANTVRELIIPETIDGCPVTVVDQFGTSPVTVRIPQYVNEIGRDPNTRTWRGIVDIAPIHTAFAKCTSLTNITVSCDNPVFTNVNGVLYNREMTELLLYPQGKMNTVFQMPDSVTNINSKAFASCRFLTDITLSESITRIGDSAFEECSALTNILIPTKVTCIGDHAFRECSALTSARIGGSVINIGNSIFYDCYSLSNITIVPHVPRIGRHMFEQCSSLSDITIPDGVTNICSEAFVFCSSLTNVTLPADLTRIGKGAFAISGLTSVNIPAGVTNIADSSFRCSELKSATFEGDAPENFGDLVFGHPPPDDCGNNFTIYFYKGATGFTTPTWNGYPCVEIERPE